MTALIYQLRVKLQQHEQKITMPLEPPLKIIQRPLFDINVEKKISSIDTQKYIENKYHSANNIINPSTDTYVN